MPVVHNLSHADAQKDVQTDKSEVWGQIDALKQQQMEKPVQHSGIKWNLTKSVEKTEVNNSSVDPIMESDHVHISSIRRFDKTVKASVIAHRLGYKIGLNERIDILKDKYIKNFIQARSHNFIVAKFAEFKAAFLGQILANLGVTLPELQKLQKQALKSSAEENELLFEENEYNAEMISIIGGSAKRIRKELKIMQEVRNQLTLQMTRLGQSEYYSDEKVLEIKLKVCRRIKDEFIKERDLLCYQKDYLFLTKMVLKREKNHFLVDAL